MGYWTQFDNISYPVKGSTEGLRMTLSVHHVHSICYYIPDHNYSNVDFLVYNHFNYTLMPNMNKLGIDIVIHDPYEMVPSTENHFTLTRADLLYLSVTPVISRIDDSLMDKKLDL